MPTTRGLGKSHPVVSCRDEKCRSRFIPAGQLDELVWKDLCDVLTHPQTIAEALHRAQGGLWLPQELQARRENVRKARVSLTQQTERLTDAYLAAVLPLEEYQRRRRELEHRQQGLAEQARQLEVCVGRHDELAGMVQSMEAFCQRVQQGLASATFDEMRHLIELLIDRVIVTNEEVEIRYVIPTSPTSEHVRFCHLRLDYFNMPSRPDGLDHLQEHGCWLGKDEEIREVVRIGERTTQEQPVASILLPPLQDGNGCPVKEPEAFGSFVYGQTLPLLIYKQELFHLANLHLATLPVTRAYPDGFITGDGKHVGVVVLLQPGTQIQVAAIHAIGYDPGERSLSR
jgi:hypothetical protein